LSTGIIALLIGDGTPKVAHADHFGECDAPSKPLSPKQFTA
jgi:hypothetical protein